jgi:predicted metal-dependent phosphoesterase TrpH
LVKIDLHVHTNLSRTSSLEVADVADFVRAKGWRVATITDFGSIEGNSELRDMLPECLIIPGLEVRAGEGDFLVYSDDEKLLASLPEKIDSVADLPRAENIATVWAHPFVSQRAKTYEAFDLPEVGAVVRHIDGIEIFNGTMIGLHQQELLRHNYFQNLMRIALDAGLAMTGGSDAHEAGVLGHCFTAFSQEITDVSSVIAALKSHMTMPGYDTDFFMVQIPLG